MKWALSSSYHYSLKWLELFSENCSDKKRNHQYFFFLGGGGGDVMSWDFLGFRCPNDAQIPCWLRMHHIICSQFNVSVLFYSILFISHVILSYKAIISYMG